MKRLIISVIFMFLHAGMELFGFFRAVFVLINNGLPVDAVIEMPLPDGELKFLFLGMLGGIFALSRITAGIAILKNRKWGLVFAVINSAIAITLSVFMLPAGIVDAVCAVAVLSCLLSLHYGNTKIVVK